MQESLGKRLAIVGGIVVVVVAMSVGVAFAAPVLRPGVVSAPGMSGVCTDCHRYATPAPPASKPPAVNPPSTKPPVVSPPRSGDGSNEGDAERHAVKKPHRAKRNHARRHRDD